MKIENKYFTFEIYVCNEETGESGWDIHFVSVKADTRQEARENLKKYPMFDCVILFQYELNLPETANFIQMKGWRDHKVKNYFY